MYNNVYIYMGVSENNGTPKSSILIGFSIINHLFWGTFIFGNTHIRINVTYPWESGLFRTDFSKPSRLQTYPKLLTKSDDSKPQERSLGFQTNRRIGGLR